MRKISKNNEITINTIEAYASSCSSKCTCSCGACMKYPSDAIGSAIAKTGSDANSYYTYFSRA